MNGLTSTACARRQAERHDKKRHRHRERGYFWWVRLMMHTHAPTCKEGGEADTREGKTRDHEKGSMGVSMKGRQELPQGLSYPFVTLSFRYFTVTFPRATLLKLCQRLLLFECDNAWSIHTSKLSHSMERSMTCPKTTDPFPPAAASCVPSGVHTRLVRLPLCGLSRPSGRWTDRFDTRARAGWVVGTELRGSSLERVYAARVL